MITFDSSHRQDVEQRKVYTPSSSSGVQAILPGIKETRRSDTNWNKRFMELQKYYMHHNTLNVTNSHEDLQQWVGMQRWLHKQGRLSVEKKTALDRVNFDWGPRKHGWDANFTLLLKFKNEHGHVDVPVKHSTNCQRKFRLGHWVQSQRAFYRNKTLSTSRIQKLEAIGFKWKAYP